MGHYAEEMKILLAEEAPCLMILLLETINFTTSGSYAQGGNIIFKGTDGSRHHCTNS